MADIKLYYDKSLIIWLQDEPGNSSTGNGNFKKVEPFDINLNSRNYTN